MEKKIERVNAFVSSQENLQCENTRLMFNNKQLDITVNSISEELNKLQMTKRTNPSNSKMKQMEPIIREMMSFCSEAVYIEYHDDRDFFCGKCGSDAFHPRGHCPARNNDCKSCNRIGHFTLTCKQLDKFIQRDDYVNMTKMAKRSIKK